MNRSMIAPCGMNCAVCIGYLREKNKCPGCNFMDLNSSRYCRECIIKHCPEKKNNTDFCYKCKKFPCLRMKNLDKRYRTRYRTSLINNLLFIKENGIREFLRKEKSKWVCDICKSIISIHRKECSNCGKGYEVELNYDNSGTNKKI
jgi:hypothetical protein